jgi:hypothetical protein
MNKQDVKKYQFYETPEEVADRVCGYIPASARTILEPSAGRGALILAIEEATSKRWFRRPKIYYCELCEENREYLAETEILDAIRASINRGQEPKESSISFGKWEWILTI